MKVSLARRLDTLARQLLPVSSTLLLVVLSIVPTHAPPLQAIAPSLPLIAVFCWALRRPDLMPPVAAFGIGLFQDLVSGLPVGASALVLLAVHAAVSFQRSFFLDRSFGILWLGFVVIGSGALVLGWLLTCLFYGVLATPWGLLLPVLMCVGLFPLVNWALWRCQQALLAQV